MSYMAARHVTLRLSTNDANVCSNVTTSSVLSCRSSAWTSFRHDNCTPSSLQVITNTSHKQRMDQLQTWQLYSLVPTSYHTYRLASSHK